MEKLLQRQQEAEQTVVFLKQQLAILTQLAVQREKALEEEEIKRLKIENNVMQNDIIKLKEDLRYHEAQNGVKNVALPKRLAPVTSTLVQEPASSTTCEKKVDKVVENKEKVSKKKEKSNIKSSGKGQASAVDNKPVDVSRLNLKVGKIVSVKRHPDADTLYVEQVDVGEERPRTIVSGLVKHVSLEQMQDRLAIFACNLKPAKMRGILSEGMIICAITPEKVEILEVPSEAAIGERVTCDGFPGEPDVQLNPKKKIWEQVQPDLRVDLNGVPGYKGASFTISGKGICKAPTMKDCPIK